MSSTIRIKKEDKKILEHIINYISFKSNKKITQEQLISVLLKSANEDKDKILESFSEPLTENEWKRDPIFNVKIKMGKDARVDLDKQIYGE